MPLKGYTPLQGTLAVSLVLMPILGMMIWNERHPPDQPTLSEDDRICLEEGMEERIMLEGYNLEILQLCQELETEVWSGLLVCGRAWTGVHPVRDCEGQKRFNALLTEQLVTDISEFRAACLADVSCEAAARGGLNYDWWHLDRQPPN